MPGIRGLSRPLLPPHELGGSTRRRESSRARERVGASLPIVPARSVRGPARGHRPYPPRRLLISRPLVRMGLAGALIGCMGSAGAMVVGPAWVLVLVALAMTAGVIALALIEEHRLRPNAATVAAMQEMTAAGEAMLRSIAWSDGELRCRVCGCTDDDPCITTDRATGLPMPCAWREPDLCSACADGERRG